MDLDNNAAIALHAAALACNWTRTRLTGRDVFVSTSFPDGSHIRVVVWDDDTVTAHVDI